MTTMSKETIKPKRHKDTKIAHKEESKPIPFEERIKFDDILQVSESIGKTPEVLAPDKPVDQANDNVHPSIAFWEVFNNEYKRVQKLDKFMNLIEDALINEDVIAGANVDDLKEIYDLVSRRAEVSQKYMLKVAEIGSKNGAFQNPDSLQDTDLGESMSMSSSPGVRAAKAFIRNKILEKTAHESDIGTE